MKYLKICCMAFVLLASQLTVVPAHAELQEYQKEIDEVVSLVNAERKAQGAAPVSEKAALNVAAHIRAQELVTYYNHLRPNGERCFTVLNENDINYMSAAENIAYGYWTPREVMEGWMESTQGHRENILNTKFDAVGVGVARSGSTFYWVQIFTSGSNLTDFYSIGDLNADDEINSKDAALLLMHAAAEGAGNQAVLSEIQLSYSDLNRDSAQNALDAAKLLQYAAYHGAGGTDSIEVYFSY